LSKNKGGRPPLFKTPESLQEMVVDYFDNLPTRKLTVGGVTLDLPTPTITGLALHLGFESRQSFYDYENRENTEYSYIIKRARLFIEHEYEKCLHGTSPTGAIFALKNFGWKDKQETELTGSLNVSIQANDSKVL